MALLKELLGVTGVKQKKGEETLVFLKRLALKANDLDEQEWERLSEPTQLWVNAALDAVQRSQPVPVPPELEVKKEFPEEEPQVEKPAKAPKAEKAPSKVSERGAFKNSDKIKFLVDENPHRPLSKDQATFAKLKNGMTVEDALTAGVDRSYLRYIVRREIASIG